MLAGYPRRHIIRTANNKKAMIPGVSLLAAHEAGHLIMYLLNCRDQIKWPHVDEIAITPRGFRGRVSLKKDMDPEYTRAIINSDLPAASKEWHRATVLQEIKQLLSGLAAELIILEFTQIYNQVLPRFYKKDKKDPAADLPRAITYNDIILGRPSDIDDLAPLLRDAIAELLPYTDHIVRIGARLDNERILTGDQLGPFIDEFMEGGNAGGKDPFFR